MLIRMILRLVFSALLCAFGTEAICAATNSLHTNSPSLTVNASFSTIEKFPLRNLELTIRAPGDLDTWHYLVASDAEVAILKDKGMLVADNWYTAPGTYSLHVSYCLEGNSQAVHQEEQEFVTGGSELYVIANLWFVENQEKRYLADLTIKRVFPSNDGISLTQLWTPSTNAQPGYRLVNSTNHSLYGVSWRNNFFGKIVREVNGKWITYPRGGFCGTVDGGNPVGPNESVDTIEGYFIGGSRPFVPGKYKYVLQYSLSPSNLGVSSDLSIKALARKRVQDIYEVSSEFYVFADEP